MPRQRRSRFSPETIESQAFFLRNQSLLPADPELLKSLVSCLLTRIETFDENLGRQLRHLSKWLASLEEETSLFPARSEKNWARANYILWIITAGQLSRKSHAYYTINAQLDWLRNYLKKLEFPIAGNNRALAIQRQERWIRNRNAAISKTLCSFPCMCSYSTLEEFEFKTVLNIKTMKPTIGNAAVAIVASVHNTTVENIRKLSKPSNLPPAPSGAPFIARLNHLLNGQNPR